MSAHHTLYYTPGAGEGSKGWQGKGMKINCRREQEGTGTAAMRGGMKWYDMREKGRTGGGIGMGRHKTEKE